jgi:serine/threonine protein phosphatase PrpC
MTDVETFVAPQQGQDRARLFAHRSTTILVLADGAGGVAGGHAASDALVEAVSTAIAGDCDAWDVRGWLRVFHETDATLSRARCAETTGIVAVFDGDAVFGVSAGDSELWIVGAEAVDAVTRGQSAARLGSGRVAPRHFHRVLLESDTVVCGSDGLFKHVAASEVAAAARRATVESAAAALEIAASRSPDDAVFAVLRRFQEHKKIEPGGTGGVGSPGSTLVEGGASTQR